MLRYRINLIKFQMLHFVIQSQSRYKFKDKLECFFLCFLKTFRYHQSQNTLAQIITFGIRQIKYKFVKTFLISSSSSGWSE